MPPAASQASGGTDLPVEFADSKSLLVAIHDVGPLFESQLEGLRDLLSIQFDTSRLALLVVPNHWGEAPLRPGSAFATRLRGWAEQGNEIFLHGWFHRDRTQHARSIDRFRASYLTAREGEFLGMRRAAAVRLMRAGSSLLEDITGKAVSGFVAPAWLYGPGAREALTELGFSLAEDHFTVWNPRSERVLSRSPVISWANRSRGRMLSSLAFARCARLLLRNRPQVRIAVHPGDIGEQSLRTSIGNTVAHFLRSHRPGRYADLLGPMGSAA
jgi:predicted deacetylase